MTREEAINVLCNTNLYPGRCGGKTAFSEALNMAISALKAQSDNDDIISRQQFADAFWKTEVEFRPSQIDEVMRILKQLPSAQPDTDRIYAELSKVYNMDGLPDEAISIIGDLMLSLDKPSAQPEPWKGETK